MELGTIGIWSLAFTHGDRAEAQDAAAELEELGYGAVWLGGSPGGNPCGDLVTAAEVLAATSAIAVTTACVSIWERTPNRLAAAYHALPPHQRNRLLIGLGVSHADFVGRYREPYHALRSYLDELDAVAAPLPSTARFIGAHGPQMSRLAAARSRGVHPYLVDPAHTTWARSMLGEGPMLALEQTVILHTSAEAARAKARTMLAPYLQLRNYRSAWLRGGFTAEDLALGGSNRLIDALFAWGSPDKIMARLTEHRQAGADHVAVQVVTDTPGTFARQAWRDLAPERVTA
ncbi:TIGR03620 family F420-dependent LLM class oxidoreductase [Streptomyces sp. MBT56]|uniref:TIGR03620 family F420-dependent LLM class oxidoreductase n=1 Tax=unclassified Streptomyces TaxID=2593676 RepID=UPI001909FD97|nr:MULTISPECIES: TIGR03620 family F420-dependent LLM class oxidoreductase [unclassified Streptomyces]MBK3533619.1 TIGR03620 family F420-dependent LLM class oxidoreductase [Streptomyces sp. MBT72]MBK3538106.1 TIGR03620 family F420-dependent LLM class oxidoreductase [Streptomyces sp. MBT67]MBK3552260.1 TIGR03620 family F420-dependent LLM class oxidoreductase [Streptomyces sp. MBT61]MBK3560298.1 TIGR03620 family F420-dependent LLM class oxidoreductase [Streptomyces sp. MBT56]MBK3599964.1 TIGR0362